jgi:hypothetical protein
MLGVPGQVVQIRPERGEVSVLTGDGVLVLEELELDAAGRRRASELIASTRTRFGLNAAEALARLEQRIVQLEAQQQTSALAPRDHE